MTCSFTGLYTPHNATTAPAVPHITPQQAAWQATTSIQLHPVKVGVPTALPGSTGTTYVNVPIWYWATNPGPGATTTLNTTRTIHGITVTLTATPTTITWNFGDGTHLTCGPGTVWTAQAYTNPYTGAPESSPTCGHTYTKPTPPGQPYLITATTTWTFHWTAAGQTGTITPPPTTSTPVPITIDELNVLNVRPR